MKYHIDDLHNFNLYFEIVCIHAIIKEQTNVVIVVSKPQTAKTYTANRFGPNKVKTKTQKGANSSNSLKVKTINHTVINTKS